MLQQKLPILFKKRASGEIQSWQIAVEGNTIVTTFGQVGGSLLRVKDPVDSGKNAGKINATTKEEQALAEAKAKWIKQKKAGYVESLKDAKEDKTDEIIEGGIVPMLAKVYEDHSDKITFPVAVQPKLDGHRCIAVIQDENKISLWTRTRKKLNSIPHIEKKLGEIAKKMKMKNMVLDGELWNPGINSGEISFEKLTSLIRKKEPSADSCLVQYHIYDCVSDRCFRERMANLSNILLYGGSTVELLDFDFAHREEDIFRIYDSFKNQGYEGAMVRQLGRSYENKRSSQLLKVKEFVDSEFVIIGAEEGRGKLIGHTGAFVCKTQEGGEFRVKMAGETRHLKEYWDNKDEYIGQNLTVKFQGLTREGIPRFPVGTRIRNDL